MFINASCEEFTEKLASSDAVPGGGGAAALCAALGASLCAMAARLTVGKKKFADCSDELKNIIAKCEALRKDFLCLVEADAEGFAPLAKAYSLPADAESRREILRNATVSAMQAPYAMVKSCCAAIELIEKLCDGRCSALLISDAGCAAALCRAALQCAAMNVFINTKTLRGDTESDTIEGETKRLLGEYLPRAEKLAERITKMLSEVE